MMVEAVFLVIVGFASFKVAFGLLKRKSWAWEAALVLCFVWIAFGIFTYVTGESIRVALPSLIISGVILYILHRPKGANQSLALTTAISRKSNYSAL